jgi:hypothetical protein
MNIIVSYNICFIYPTFYVSAENKGKIGIFVTIKQSTDQWIWN